MNRESTLAVLMDLLETSKEGRAICVKQLLRAERVSRPWGSTHFRLNRRRTPGGVLIERQCAWRIGFEVCRDQCLGAITAGRLPRMAARIASREVGASASPPTAEFIAHTAALDQIVGTIGDTLMACVIDCPVSAIEHE
jgi:hypothetical protein